MLSKQIKEPLLEGGESKSKEKTKGADKAKTDFPGKLKGDWSAVDMLKEV